MKFFESFLVFFLVKGDRCHYYVIKVREQRDRNKKIK